MESDISKTEQGDPVPKDERNKKKKLLGGGATKGGSTVTEWDQATCDGHNTRRRRTDDYSSSVRGRAGTV